MSIWQWLFGYLSVEMTCGDPAEMMRQLNAAGIMLFHTEFVSELQVKFRIRRQDCKRLNQLAHKRGAALEIRESAGLWGSLRMLRRRKLMAVQLALVLGLSWFLPGRILLLEIEGNEAVPARLIVEAAQESGIPFGVKRREIRSEKLKNALLEKIPQLQWAGINTYGSRGVITVHERVAGEQSESGKMGRIVAARDGVVLSCTVTRGNGLVQPGQAVLKGQLLISGYTDCGLCLMETGAEGEIFALTQRNLTVTTPSVWQVRLSEQGKQVFYGLRIGKKRINFYKGSGISGGSCVKMYKEYVLTLPGGFVLPISLLRETVITCKTEELQRNKETVASEVSAFAGNYLRSRMAAGEIIRRQEVTESGITFRMTGSYLCQEMIGRGEPAEMGEYHGKTD